MTASNECERKVGVSYEGFHKLEHKWYFVTKEKTVDASLEAVDNVLLLEGHSGSGKSSTLENVLVPLLGMDSHILNASDCTPTALNKSASSSNFMPLIIDEYKPSRIDKYRVNTLSNLLRNSYDLHKGIRGVPTLTKISREIRQRESKDEGKTAGLF
jgi:hypothetical protein